METPTKWLWEWAKITAAMLYVGFLVGMGFRFANPPSPQPFRVSACPPQPSKENSP